MRSRTERLRAMAQYNKPLPIMLSALRAHTSRYTAGNEGVTDGLNFQNFGKRDKKKATLRKAIKVEPGMKVVAADSSQIEARMNAYLSCEEELLNGFRRGEDVYSQLGEKIFNRPWQEIRAGDKAGDPTSKMQRFVSKTGILSAGYGVSALKFSQTLLRSGVKIHTDLEKHHELAKHAHYIYRESNPNIVRFWRRCQEVIEHLYQGGTGQFGGPNDDVFSYGMLPICGGESIPSIVMPTGYMLRYPNLRPEMEEGRKHPQFYYDRMQGRNKAKTRIYGAALVENLCQGISFQLLIYQAISMLDQYNIRSVTNNHDCWVTVVPESKAQETLDNMIKVMSIPPIWLPNFPCAAEGNIADDFTIA